MFPNVDLDMGDFEICDIGKKIGNLSTNKNKENWGFQVLFLVFLMEYIQIFWYQ